MSGLFCFVFIGNKLVVGLWFVFSEVVVFDLVCIIVFICVVDLFIELRFLLGFCCILEGFFSFDCILSFRNWLDFWWIILLFFLWFCFCFYIVGFRVVIVGVWFCSDVLVNLCCREVEDKLICERCFFCFNGDCC